MAIGWAKDGAVQDQIDDSIRDEISRAQSKLYKGESRKYCEECGEEIPPGSTRGVARRSLVHSLPRRGG